jgi:hypothetical protein
MDFWTNRSIKQWLAPPDISAKEQAIVHRHYCTIGSPLEVPFQALCNRCDSRGCPAVPNEIGRRQSTVAIG